MIALLNKHNRPKSAIIKVGDNKWEFYHVTAPSEPGWEYDELLEKTYLDAKGIISLIKALKDLLSRSPKKEVVYQIDWLENPCGIKLEDCKYDYGTRKYQLHYTVLNKCFKLKYLTQDDELLMEDGYPDPRYYGRKGPLIFTTKENLEKYIKELEVEIGVTPDNKKWYQFWK
jgi:hypothetical protein